jgi:hypothetical protein
MHPVQLARFSAMGRRPSGYAYFPQLVERNDALLG